MIRQKVSAIIEMPIREGAWVSYIDSLDREGSFDRKKLIKIIFAACEAIDELENQVEALKYKQDAKPSKRA